MSASTAALATTPSRTSTSCRYGARPNLIVSGLGLIPLDVSQPDNPGRLEVVGVPPSTPVWRLAAILDALPPDVLTVGSDGEPIEAALAERSWLVWLLNYYLAAQGLTLVRNSPPQCSRHPSAYRLERI